MQELRRETMQMQQSVPALWRDSVQVRAVGRVRAGLIERLAAEIGGPFSDGDDEAWRDERSPGPAVSLRRRVCLGR